MVQRLYLLDRQSGIDLGKRLQTRGFLTCVCGPQGGDLDPQKETFQDNLSFWRLNEVTL